MKLKYDMSRCGRVKNRMFLGVRVDNMLFLTNLRTWVDENKMDAFYDTEPWSNFAECKSVRAFRRMIRKNNLNKGCAHLISRYIGYDVHN
jgi:hypothetical protein